MNTQVTLTLYIKQQSYSVILLGAEILAFGVCERIALFIRL